MWLKEGDGRDWDAEPDGAVRESRWAGATVRRWTETEAGRCLWELHLQDLGTGHRWKMVIDRESCQGQANQV